ncbi:hypothetical protein [Sandaracinus amylolyticus]|uniref:hypothetical protein n=1 Tax=Sandaracinus amylolyticus TaxID=927083 RepID=UPI001F157D82|nr:hypothetical protein [Sandaracinus amylolyticus]UJR85103.1 Hypothetical protein I5071_71830 [Sandaracinus amylolyticus]
MSLFGQPSAAGDPRATTLRRCGKCKADAVTCYHVTFHYVNGIPAGRTYEHRCRRCGRQFTTISLWRLLRDGFAASLIAVLGLFLAPWLTYEGVFVNRLMGMDGGEWFALALMWAFAIGGPAWLFVLALRTYRLFENPIAQVPSR